MHPIYKILLFQLLLVSFHLKAQKLDTFIGNYKGGNANSFLQPVTDVLTSSFNTGTAHKTSIDSGFHVYFGVITTTSFILSDKLKYFESQTPENFTPTQTAKVSTVLGPSSITVVEGKNGTSYTFPAGLGLKAISLAAPQITIGSLFGTEISFRYMAFNFDDDFGKLSLMGVGIRHDIGKYFLKKSKFIVTTELNYQDLQIGKYSDLKTFKVGVYAGQQSKNFHYFTYLGYQSGKQNISYYNSSDEKDYSVQLTNKNPLLIGLGAGLKVSVLRIHTQINLISPIAVALGIGLNF
ncbi:MAG: DUF6588 family protein [Bacteroidota bacterium]